MQRKSLAIATTLCTVAALSGMLLLLPGCSGTPATQVASSSEQPNFQNVTLTVACPNETGEKIVTEYGPGWTHKTGAHLQVVRYPANEAVLPQSDVVLLSPSELPAFAPELATVPTSIQDPEGSSRWNDVFPMYRTRLLKWDEKTYAVPVLGDAVVCFYRRDLLDDPNHQTEFKKKFRRPLQPPATWEDVLEIAEYFHDNQADPRPVKHALPPSPASPAQLDHLFYSVAAPYTRRGESAEGDQDPDRFSFQFDIKTGESRIARPGFVHALHQLQKMQQYRPSAPDANPWHEFAKGVGVVYVGPVHELLLFQQHQDSKVRDLIGICPVPGTREYFPYNAPMPVPAENGLNVVPYRGARGLLGAVPARSGHTEAAWSFLAELSSPNLSRQIVSDPRWGGCPYRLTHVREERWDGFKLRPEQTDQLRKTLTEPSWRDPKNPVVQLRIPHAPLYQKDLLVEVNRCLFEKKSPASALETVDTAWRKRAKERGKDHGVEYQLNWGLRQPVSDGIEGAAVMSDAKKLPGTKKLAVVPAPAKQPFDIEEAMRQLRIVTVPYPKAALFELYAEGYTSVFQILTACIISIRTRDEETLPISRRLFATAGTPAEVAALSADEINRLITPSTFHGVKAKTIREIARKTVADLGETIPCDLDTLLKFKGVGPKCANLALGIACNQPLIGVDIHVHRVTNRWGYVTAKTPEKTMAALQAKLPQAYWVEINALLVPFGKHVCTGTRPKCSTCPLLDMCQQVGVTSHR